ncbi:DNA mismatch repair endonuclease MutL [Marinithermus hydrothermalis]|uniref:DNA mismatch repair protein MutL n=1 Tax=Marinithermus hydrothermalis (strain DSM 14884 / JCM 11576 / T1) TaxID=869210 RepID=F2NPE2_MARHT|nr:DNA mismatch repair endonuclease MutL [Marinithermus hydrothermalis]AEB12223.1 DNA mismatch repair protein mutL [Marinithermus hydrothermalis DSM 14884]
MIRRLPPELVREIAAGEVVTAPVDVVKELVENALDAGATRIEVELWAGGIEKIVVTDNGAGIPKAELPLALERHATSKLEDLSRIRTLGFRGEGLFAIRASARLRLTSRPADQLGGATVEAEGEAVTLVEHPAPPGTRVEVTRLFAHLPARRAALESPAAEGKKIVAYLTRVLLHRPYLRLRLAMDGEEKWVFAGGEALEAARFIWGPVTANRLLPVRMVQEGLRLEGLISRPELVRPRRDRLHLAVNGRPVEWPEGLLRAVVRAYRELLPAGQYPVGVLNLELPPEAVLVNTTPAKDRVRLLEPERVAEFVERAVSETLAAHPLARPLPELRPVEGVRPARGHRFPRLRYLGRFRDLYLIAEAEDELWVVDQHAAHERILFEELCRRYREEPPVELAHPELVPLTPEEEARYAERSAELTRAGLVLEPFGSRRYRVRSVPAFLAAHPELVAEVVKGALGPAGFEKAWRAVLGRLACLPAIRAGHPLAQASAQALLDQLAACETPWVCPHGRPTALVLSELELARRFGRRGQRAVPFREVEEEA